MNESETFWSQDETKQNSKRGGGKKKGIVEVSRGHDNEREERKEARERSGNGDTRIGVAWPNAFARSSEPMPFDGRSLLKSVPMVGIR